MVPALICRSFFDSPTGPEEFAYIPEDMLALLPAPGAQAREPLGRPASPLERTHPVLANDRLVDHATTLLAALRLGLPLEEVHLYQTGWESPAFPLAPPPLTLGVLQSLLTAAALLDGTGLPQVEPVRVFLEAPRGDALAILARAWLDSSLFNDLRLVPTLKVEGEWQNDPRHARQSVIDFILTVSTPDDRGERPFWSLSAFVQSIRQHNPDFQRPAGDYDSWFCARHLPVNSSAALSIGMRSMAR